jgi:RNA polymerase sigma-70 factor (ECF subfamily)
VERQAHDWAEIVGRLLEGDELAFLQVGRLVRRFLAGWRAEDFRDEWPDLVQEVILAVIKGVRGEELRTPQAMVGYIRTIARNKLMDRLRQHVGREQRGELPWSEAIEKAALGSGDPGPGAEELLDLRRALERLSEKKRKVVLGVYGEGKTYQVVADETGIPLGSLKRYLREALEELGGALHVAPREA